MKRINKDHITGFFIGLFSVLLLELMINTEKYIPALKEGWKQAEISEIRSEK